MIFNSLYILFLLFSTVFLVRESFSQDCQINYRQEMRKFVIKINKWVKRYNPEGIVVVQGGYDLLTSDGTPEGEFVNSYINAIDGQAVEDLFYGWEEDNEATPEDEQNWIFGYLDRLILIDKMVFSTDYVWEQWKVDDQIQRATSRGYIPFPTPCRELNCIPYYPESPVNENNEDITALSQVQNYLYIINPENFENKRQFINTLKDTNYDLLVIDATFDGLRFLKKKDIKKLKIKANGGKRLVLAYLSIGEAEDYRWYWKRWWWKFVKKDLLGPENPYWEGNYLVKYWKGLWKRIVRIYIRKIMRAGFDGVFLDKVDSYETWEEITGCSFYN